MSQKSFTLIELLVVIALFALLLGIVIIHVKNARQKAKIAKILTWSKSIHSRLGANIVGEWKFEEVSATDGTTIIDSSGNGNNGILHTGDGENKSQSGVVGNALYFDGVDDYVDCGSDESLNITDEITIEAWVNCAHIPVTNPGWGETILRKQDAYMLSVKGSGSNAFARFFLWGGIGNLDSEDFSIHEWHHIVATYDGSVQKIYIDGTFSNHKNISGSIPVSSEHLYIAKQVGDSTYFHGIIDEVRIYKEALPSAVIQKHYVQGLQKLLAKGLIDQQEYQKRLLAER